MAILGPTRLILIHSGTFDFANIDLTRPLHLVGPNNIGKTTLVNLLQFLYVDNINHMSFAGYEARETRQYYFPERYSYVLFECRTPAGIQVVGVHGKGPAENYAIQRFAYQGPWEARDFMTPDGAPRPIDDVEPELALKRIRYLEAHHLRSALTGIGDNKAVHLGLVPVQNRSGYKRFRSLFKGLIRLRHLDQQTLKATLCNTYASELGNLSINLQTDYADQFAKMEAQRNDVKRLEEIEGDIREVLDSYQQRQQYRAEIARQWTRLLDRAARLARALQAVDAAHAQTIQETQSTQKRLQEKYRALDATRDALNQKLGIASNDLERLHASIEAASDVDPDRATRTLKRVRKRRRALQAQVQSIDADDPSRIRRRLARMKKKVAQSKRRLQNLETAVGPMLRKALGETRMKRLFRVLNPEMLDLSHDTPHLNITDRKALFAHLQHIDEQLTADPWKAPWGTLSLRGLTAPSIEQYTDPDRIRADRQQHLHEQKRLQERLDIAENRSALEQEIRALDADVEALQSRLRLHHEAQQAKEQLSATRKRKSRLEAEMREATKHRDTVSREIRTHTDRIKQAQSKQKRIQQAQQELEATRRALQAPPSEWDAAHDDASRHDDASPSTHDTGGQAHKTSAPTVDVNPEAPLARIRADIDAYHEAQEREQRTDGALRRLLQRIHKRTTGKYDRGSLKDTLHVLRDELNGLTQRRDAARRMWQQLMTGLSRNLSDLLSSLDALRAKIDAINRRLRNTSISDLKRLKLVISPIADTVHLLERTAAQDAMPLFGDAQAHEDDMRRLDAMLRTHPSIHLTDLFNVAFRVTTVDGAVKSYDGLRSIESNGTSISIKVLVHLVLINDLLGDEERTLPFYLDEASSLDDQNLAGIVRASTRMGFVPILASPTESTAVDHLYFLRSTGNRVYLGPEQCVRLRPRPSPDASADASADAPAS